MLKKCLMIGLYFFSLLTPVFAINTAKIDVVRGKEAIADTDVVIIEEFLSEAFSEFFAKTDFSDIASLRSTIVSKSTSATQSGQILYGPKYIASAQKELAETLKKVNALPDSFRKSLLTTNLLIVINDLAAVETSKLALDYIQNPNAIIRYWAVNSLTNSNILAQINASSQETGRNIAQKLLDLAKNEQSPEILIILAQFAAELKQPLANDILTTIAQKRIDGYLSWSVNAEMTDDWVLKALADRTKTDSDNTKLMAGHFSSLYSLVIQRYVFGDQVLDEVSKNNLITVIVQAEKYVQIFIPDWSGNFKRAIEKSGSAALLAESEALFGSAGAAGKLPTTVGFDYGKNADGSAKTAPPELPKPEGNING